MEAFIRKALSRYNTYKAEVQLYQLLRDSLPEHVRDKEFELMELRMTAIASWISILSEDEAFVVVQHLVNEISWPRVVYAYQQKAMVGKPKGERMLKQHQANAFVKIGAFIESHGDVIEVLFEDILKERCDYVKGAEKQEVV